MYQIKKDKGLLCVWFWRLGSSRWGSWIWWSPSYRLWLQRLQTVQGTIWRGMFYLGLSSYKGTVSLDEGPTVTVSFNLTYLQKVPPSNTPYLIFTSFNSLKMRINFKHEFWWVQIITASQCDLAGWFWAVKWILAHLLPAVNSHLNAPLFSLLLSLSGYPRRTLLSWNHFLTILLVPRFFLRLRLWRESKDRSWIDVWQRKIGRYFIKNIDVVWCTFRRTEFNRKWEYFMEGSEDKSWRGREQQELLPD